MPNNEAWRSPVRNVVYSVQFADELTDELAAHHAQRMLAQPTVALTQQEQYDALMHAVAYGNDLGGNIEPPHSDDQLREFLSKVVAEMDRQRPWTEPPLRVLPFDRWSDFTDAPPVAALKLSVTDVRERLRHGFVQRPDDGRRICLLALTSGNEIALVADYWPETGDMAVLTHAAEPQQIVDYLVANTDLTESDFAPVG